MSKFETGKIYYCRSACDYNCVWNFIVERRTNSSIWIRDVGIAPNAWGRPEVIWSDRGRALRDRLGAGEGHVTLTDEAGLVVAVAVLMRKESK